MSRVYPSLALQASSEASLDQLPLDAAIASANQWLTTARPVIKLLFAIEDAEWDMRRAADDQTSGEASCILRKPRKELLELVEGIRDNFLCDVSPPQPDADAPQSVWDARDEFMDDVARSVISVNAAVKLVGDEM